MRMIIGGAYQGKLEFALGEVNELKREDYIDGKECGFTDIFAAKGILRFHEYVRRLLAEDPGRINLLAKELEDKNPDIIIITDEIGYGIVPMDPFERDWREMTGRVCTELAAYSDSVVRVVMGVGIKIK